MNFQLNGLTFASEACNEERRKIAMSVNVFDFGARGDGRTDDTAAIQAAIDFTAKRGGGKIFFPYTREGYCIASPGREFDEAGRQVRAQLILPADGGNIQLEGEMPCQMLYSYQVRPMDVTLYTPTLFGTMSHYNTRLFSVWDAPEEYDQSQEPWSILAAPTGDNCKGKFSTSQVTLTNLEFRVALRHDKMYPTQSAVNLHHVSRINVRDCQFCLNENVGDTLQNKELQPNPCHTAGLIASGDQNDNNVLNNVAVQGFRYGFVLGEHVVADYLYVHNCEEAITFHDCSHMSVINHVVAQHNQSIITTTRGKLFGNEPGPCNVIISSVNFEDGRGFKPKVDGLIWGVYDPDNRFHGKVTWFEPWGCQEFPVCGGKGVVVEHF